MPVVFSASALPAGEKESQYLIAVDFWQRFTYDEKKLNEAPNYRSGMLEWLTAYNGF